MIIFIVNYSLHIVTYDILTNCLHDLCSSRQEILPRIRTSNLSLDPAMGFQVDRIKHAEAGEGKVRLTAYYKSNGKVRIISI